MVANREGAIRVEVNPVLPEADTETDLTAQTPT